MRVVVAMPVYNEANGISEFVEEVASAMSPYDTTLVVADDCSTDDTLQVLAGLSLIHQIVILPGERNMGHGPTTLRALQESLAHQPDVVVAVDGDGQFTGHDMRKLVDLLITQGLDVGEGVRVGRNDPLFRRATSWATRTLVHARIGERPLDANTPLRVYRPPALEALLREIPTDAITPNLLISALARVSDLRIVEERVASIPRRGGDPAGTSWRARRKSVPNMRFMKFCLEAGQQWATSPLRQREGLRTTSREADDARGLASPSALDQRAQSSAAGEVGTADACLQCGSGAFVPVLSNMTSVYSRSVPWAVSECRDCGLLHTSPRPTREELAQIYANSYSYGAHDAVAEEKARRARGLLEALKFDIDGKAVLDIGCGSGVLLGEMQARGARVSGCEVSADAVDQANEHLGYEAVTCASVEDYLQARSEVPEVCILSHSLEHLLSPLTVLRRIRVLLPPGGRLVVVVPNAAKAPRGRLRKYWGYWQVPVHVVHFTENTLKQMLVSAGFVPQATEFRNSDFLSIGLAASNILGLDVQQATPKGPLTSAAIRLASATWSHLYRWGAQDLIIVSSPSVGRQGGDGLLPRTDDV